MLPLLLVVAIGYLSYHLYCLLSNIRLARSIGLPYVVVPFHVYSIFWILGGARLYPLLEKLPYFPRLRWIRPDWFWYRKYEMYREVNSDTFFLVSASGLLLLVCDADVTQDILTRKEDFPKPPQVHPALDIFGRNVVTTNGAEWKKHRRIITSHFSENYNRLAWTKALEKTDLLVKDWKQQIPGEPRGPKITTTAEDFMRLTLHITFFNMFGLHLRWPNRIWTAPHETECPPTDEEIPAGHNISFQSSLHQVLEYCIILLVSPSWYLKYTPVKAHRQAGEAHTELHLYIKQMVQEKREAYESGRRDNDLISALIQAKDTGEKSAAGTPGLTEQEVIGNVFMLIFTGHATTTNTLHYTIMMLALYPQYQIKLQEDLDRILGDQEPNYERDYQALAEGWAGAIFYEVLRLFPSVPNLPKFTTSPQYIKVNGSRYLIPQGTHVHLNTTNTHRNPKYWVPPHQTEQEAALNEFRPERWFTNNLSAGTQDKDAPAPRSFFTPYQGSYFPWSGGQRVCLGKKYSIVELIAVYAVIFREWSVELDVQEGETPAEAWSRAKKYVDEMEVVLALKPKGKEPGIRYVRRGKELYFPPRK